LHPRIAARNESLAWRTLISIDGSDHEHRGNVQARGDARVKFIAGMRKVLGDCLRERD
jgi:hypothetical protein